EAAPPPRGAPSVDGPSSVVASSSCAGARRRLDGSSSGGGKTQFLDVIARHPFPEDIAGGVHFDEPIVFKWRVRDVRTSMVDVREDERLSPLDGRRRL